MQSLTIRELELRRGGRDGFRLGPLDLDLAAGSRTALIGPSGCGKSTLLRLIAGLERAYAGTIAIGDRVVSDGRRSRLPPDQRGIGFVFQDGALWPHMTAAQHLRFVAPGLDTAAIQAQLDRVGLGALADRRPAKLSGGEAQRLSLARALAREPEMLLLDEPLASVDVHLRDELAALVRQIAVEQGLTLIVVTHDREEALSMADDVVVLRSGHIVELGPAERLIEAPTSAFAATFLAHAACLPLTADGAGVLRSPFGRHEAPAGAAPDDHVLAVLPADVMIDAVAGDEACRADVVQVRTDSFGRRHAVLRVGAQTLIVPCEHGVEPGRSVGLRLVAAPRILPASRIEAVRA